MKKSPLAFCALYRASSGDFCGYMQRLIYIFALFSRFSLGAYVVGRVEGIEVVLIQMLLRASQNIAESLEMHDLPLTQEADDVVDVGIVGQT